MLEGFRNTKTTVRMTTTGEELYLIEGELAGAEDARRCHGCGCRMHIHDNYDVNLRHLCIGGTLCSVRFAKSRYICPCCGRTEMQTVPFQAEGHRITDALLTYTKDLLERGFTNRQVCGLTGLGRNTVKEIDLKRLRDRYTDEDGTLARPETPARCLGVDEFSLHGGHSYATVIIDMDNGHILWIAHGRRKSAVRSFIEHVGLGWMDGVEAVACDMNSDYQEAFEEMCPHIQCVFDFFHIKRNFNDKVVSEIRKDEQRRLAAEGDSKAAESLKRSRYILTSSRATLERKDSEAGRVLRRGGGLFGAPEVVRRGGNVARYEAIVNGNRLLFTAELVSEKLTMAYGLTDEAEMAREVSEVMDMCRATGNRHLLWFHRLLENHFEGIIAHATFGLSSGKVEGTNRMIKGVRSQGYGYPDDEYFFLKLFDASRRVYVRNQKSHKLCD